MTTTQAGSWAFQGSVPPWTITDRLRKSREITGLDQVQFAHEIGCSRATVSNYERGAKAHTKSVLMTWAMRSGVPLEWLLNGQEAPPSSTPGTHPSRENANRVLRLAPAA
jgi:transcriptional regulator with XRE-family HTH domain